jgi:hypothetical protein
MPASWRQFAAIPYGLDVDRVLRALDLQIPPEAPKPHSFHASGLYVTAVEGGFSLLDTAPDHRMEGAPGARLLTDGSAVLKQARWPAGTETGDALRRWLRLHGWVPQSERAVDAAQQATRTVI